MSLTELTRTQDTYEQRFNCVVCLCPKLEMVYGLCQHRACADCIYGKNEIRRSSFASCPICQRDAVFPVIRPDIPEDNIELQKCLGLRECTNLGCHVQMWEWEVEQHLEVCIHRTEPSIVTTPNRRRSAPMANSLRLSSQKSNLCKTSPRITRSRTLRSVERPTRLRQRRH